MPSWRPDWTPARTWFVTVRVLEAAAALLVLGQVLDAVTAWRQVVAFGPTGPDGTVLHLTFLQHVTAFAQTSVYRPVVLSALFTALVVLAGVAVLHRVRPVSHARLLRWELLVLGAVQLLVALVGVAASVVSMFARNPFETAPDPGTVTVWTGPGPIELGLVGLGPSVATAAVLAVAVLWWVRLPAEFEEDGVAALEDAAPGDDSAVPDDGNGSGVRDAASAGRRRPRRRALAGGGADDAIVLDGVEEIAPVERLSPVEGGDGATASGYEDWLRRS
ncbi:hypothetical protein [Phycicoccus sp. 3266]|uniref:hypothetical protein n=1 Tax=Phycicoccus sp. 3266 TaxID=2817751 RepID=UPI0028624970|nr:hypothetical protein [Phycicoccus sp. 3266]MDR6861918.1 hypothetical protein [Phycicoccus sp. 3266]